MAKRQVVGQKRQDIQKANKNMFFWVAGVSVVVGAAIVVSIFLMQKVMFKEKVLSEKKKTETILVANNKAAENLKNNVRALNANQELIDSMITGEQNAVSVVLDALPSTANSSAFGASLQKKILETEGITIDSLIVDPVVGIESQNTMSSTLQDSASSSGSSTNVIYFKFTISTPSDRPTALKTALERIEKSIRPIDITTLSVSTETSRTSLTASGVTYYEPAKSVQLINKTVKP
jgi:hypothetical protein